jgi:hypothetical protein
MIPGARSGTVDEPVAVATRAIDHSACHGIDVELVQRVSGFKVIPRRWVIERASTSSCTTRASPETTQPTREATPN